MKSAYQIAKEIGVSYQAVYKRLTPELMDRLSDHVQQRKKKKYFDEYAEAAIKAIYKPVNERTRQADEPVNEQTRQADEPVNERTRQADEPVNERTRQADEPVNERTRQADEPVNERTGQADEPVNERTRQADEPVNERTRQADESLFNRLSIQLHGEIEYLRRINDELRDELKVEREHSREIALQVAKLTQNNQILLAVEKEKKTGFFSRFRRRKNSGIL